MTGAVTMLICKIPMNFLITFVYVLFYYLNYAMIYSTLAISLLRVAAVLRPIDSSKLQYRLSWILASMLYALPLVTTWFLIPAMAFYTPILDSPHESASVTVDYTKVFPEWRNSLALVFVTSLACVFDLICFFITIIGWRMLISKRLPASYKRSEKSLLLLTCSVCISLSLNCILQFFFYFDILIEFSFLMRGFVYDVQVFAPTWVFYHTHPAFKKDIRRKPHLAVVVPTFLSNY
ncbi:hypothetical protein V3C99_015591 [Haemonchus contortus]